MLEPTIPGFTGQIWEARPPEQLARDLVTGVGAVPAAEAGLAWARVSAGFAAAAIDYERILENLSSAWESTNSKQFIERIRALRDWFATSAAEAANNAAQAESHAAAYEIARLAMPDADDVEKLKHLREMLEQLGTAIGAPMLAKLAQTDTDSDTVKAVAARVMRTYEGATETLATPWEHQAAPEITAGMTTTQSVPQVDPETVTPEMPSMPSIPLGSFNMPPVITAFQQRGVTEVNSNTTQRVVVQPVTVQQSGSVPMSPGAMSPQGQDEGEHTTRSGLTAPAGDEELGLTSGMQVAPAVLGGLDPNAQQRVPDIAFNAGSTGTENASPAAPAAPAATAEATP
ncbi:PPE domain-containing protein [Nocardia sp. SYP-A9097]|uniref:PPE domain-containing protein n=1 Tax=Nocardia sp. SYP-A9097 TaxID=2663237 RepID=UPI00129BB28A|nr:PPE domain-containing protein [Nocardia sp. SYP-A9097]MRH88647.1 PPE domain-containing protein [Nocardia sp. SYP-A9097]